MDITIIASTEMDLFSMPATLLETFPYNMLLVARKSQDYREYYGLSLIEVNITTRLLTNFLAYYLGNTVTPFASLRDDVLPTSEDKDWIALLMEHEMGAMVPTYADPEFDTNQFFVEIDTQ